MEQPDNHQPRTRQEIYDAIAKSSKEDFILEEMKRFGFWDISQPVPKVSEELTNKRKKLQTELNDLLKIQQQYNNTQKLMKEMRAERMAAALIKRKNTKERKIALRTQKAEVWAENQIKNISYLGEGVSGGLNNQQSETAKLQQLGLPIFETAEDLSKAMKLSMSELRFLAYHRKTSTVSHYQRFEIPKKTGGQRLISAPMPRLKKAQYWILENILYKLSTHKAAHGFVPQLSIVSNAQNHIGKQVLINIDLKDFFPTVTFKRIKGLFVALGYAEQLATIFALLCSEPNVDKVELDGKTFFVSKGERLLPQGAPTSPAITNLICHKLDLRLAGLSKKFNYQYSRYADDISFSAIHSDDINLILRQAQQIVTEEGFVVNPKKIQVMRAGSQKEVTGIVVNEKLNVSREQMKIFRSVLHTLATKGADKVKFGGADLQKSIQGFANFINMVNAEKGEKILAEVNLLLSKPEIQQQLNSLKGSKPAKFSRKAIFQPKIEPVTVQNTENISSNTSNSENANTDWWDIFA
jgi:RNA-directed DNA polymerase